MIDSAENIFDYDLKDLERKVLNLAFNDETSYILFTQPLKILSDLHLLFLIRNDRINRNRIIRNFKAWDVSVEQNA